jgi:uncharacterized protein (TIRG00374 family)
VPTPWGAVLLAFSSSKVLSSIGITPGGLGLVEGSMVATFVAYGVPGASAGAAVLVYRALTLIGLVGLGWLVVAVQAVESRAEAGVHGHAETVPRPLGNPTETDRGPRRDGADRDS